MAHALWLLTLLYLRYALLVRFALARPGPALDAAHGSLAEAAQALSPLAGAALLLGSLLVLVPIWTLLLIPIDALRRRFFPERRHTGAP